MEAQFIYLLDINIALEPLRDQDKAVTRNLPPKKEPTRQLKRKDYFDRVKVVTNEAA